MSWKRTVKVLDSWSKKEGFKDWESYCDWLTRKDCWGKEKTQKARLELLAEFCSDLARKDLDDSLVKHYAFKAESLERSLWKARERIEGLESRVKMLTKYLKTSDLKATRHKNKGEIK